MQTDHHLSTPISEAFIVFRLHCRSQRYSPKSIEFYDNLLPPFFNWLAEQGVSHVDNVTSHHIRAHLVNKQTVFVDTDHEREASGHTVHAVARAIRAFFNFCVAEEWLTASPMRTVKMPRRPTKVLEAYTKIELKLLLNACTSDREKTIIYLLLDTGVRNSECVSLRAGDVKWEMNSLSVIRGKGEKDRVVYFGAKTARYLIRHMRGLESNDYLFPNSHTGKKMNRNGLTQLLRRIGKAAGVQCTAHKFRRTFAINSLRNGMDIYTLAKLMGHTDITVLRAYLPLVNSDLRVAQERYGVVDNL